MACLSPAILSGSEGRSAVASYVVCKASSRFPPNDNEKKAWAGGERGNNNGSKCVRNKKEHQSSSTADPRTNCRIGRTRPLLHEHFLSLVPVTRGVLISTATHVAYIWKRQSCP